MVERLLTGDRPTGKLHLGHWVGSIKNRVALQEKYDAYLIIADLHVLTTKRERSDLLKIRENASEMVLDYLACGIDPTKTTIYLQSACPAVYQMNLIFEMMISLNRLTGLPSLKDMARSANIEQESIPFGLVGYPVLQAADILMGKSHVVPVGKDNEAHVEIARLLARRFNQLYGEIFPIPTLVLSHIPSLIGTDGKAKMSKSLGNYILLSDPPAIVEKKVKGMYTDPNRIRADTPGTVEGNPVFIYHDAFNDNLEQVKDLKERYRLGTVGDVEVKRCLTDALNRFLDPIRERRKLLEGDKGLVERVVFEGTEKMIEFSNETLKEMIGAMGLGWWKKISRVARSQKER